MAIYRCSRATLRRRGYEKKRLQVKRLLCGRFSNGVLSPVSGGVVNNAIGRSYIGAEKSVRRARTKRATACDHQQPSRYTKSAMIQFLLQMLSEAIGASLYGRFRRDKSWAHPPAFAACIKVRDSRVPGWGHGELQIEDGICSWVGDGAALRRLEIVEVRSEPRLLSWDEMTSINPEFVVVSCLTSLGPADLACLPAAIERLPTDLS